MTVQVDYEGFFEGTIRALERYSARWVGDSGEGENIAGEVMLLVHSRWGDLCSLPDRAVKSFAYRAAAFRARNHLRLKSRMDTPLDFEEGSGIGHEKDPMARVELRADLTKVIEGMPELLAEVVRLRLFAELSFSEIGEILEVPEGTARRRFHDGALRMRKNLEHYVT